MDALLHVLHSDGADALKLQVGCPPVIVMGGEENPLESTPLTLQDIEQLLHGVTDTRQRRALRQNGDLQFVYRHRGVAQFIVLARLAGDQVHIHVH